MSFQATELPMQRIGTFNTLFEIGLNGVVIRLKSLLKCIVS